ncbi:membrane bound O-acyl transferase family-domain-containing protein [Diaporthe sp. PMI_573]|nr:membrane bound O-acyl transferase family-domain-containing protein [Diaporthaceae sp. PMI_573]
MNHTSLLATQLEDRSVANDVFSEANDSIIPHIALYVTQLVALASPKFPGRRFVFSGILLALMAQATRYPRFTNDMGRAQPFCIQWSFWLATMEKLLLSGEEGPEAHFWRVDKGPREAESYYGFSFRKLSWAFMLILNQRGVGWNHQVKNVPKVTQTKKSAFLINRLFWLATNFLMADLLFHLGIRFFYTNPETGVVGDVNSKFLTLDYACPGWRFTTIFVFAATPYFALSFQNSLFSIIFVSLGFGGPEDWPDQFNSISEAFTVRLFWGNYWHQNLRRGLATWANAFVDLIGIRHGTNLSSYTQLWFSFLVSGYFHTMSHFLFPPPLNITVAERIHPIFVFFILQAAAVTFEDFVQWAWCKALGMGDGVHRWRRVVGYIWVAGWMWYSVKFIALAFLKTRVGAESPLPFTVVGPWMEYVPMPF